MNNPGPVILRGGALLLTLCLSLIALASCGRNEPAAPPAAERKPSTAQTEPIVLNPDQTAPTGLDEAAMLDRLLADADEGPEPKTEADKAWRDLRKALVPPRPPIEWMTNRPNDQAIAAFEKSSALAAVQAADKARDFFTKYADDARAAQARVQERELLNVAAEAGNTNALARVQTLDEARLKDPALPEDERLLLRVQQLQRGFAARERAEPTNALAAFETGVRALQKEFPERSELAGLLMAVAKRWVDLDPARSRVLAQELAKADVEEELKGAAQELLKLVERVGKPFPLKFTALDGRQVDLAQMKGKVVLVDFWATWCQPCMVELPNLKAAYAALHPRGFEIAGISLDSDKADLERVIASEKIAWPQCFDPSENGNKFAEEFGITSIPTLWLVDKKGLLRDLNAGEDLARKVERLLAEK